MRAVINISTQPIRLGLIKPVWDLEQTDIFQIPYDNLERTFADRLYALIQDHTITELLVINWPGWFTALRICATTIATFQTTMENLKVYSLNKIKLFQSILTTTSTEWLPIKYYLWVWQKRRCRAVDLTTWAHATILKEEVTNTTDIPFVSEEELQLDTSLVITPTDIIDRVRDTQHTFFTDKYLTRRISPDYMIQPTLG